jgi:YVTN family beta-propeller protein
VKICTRGATGCTARTVSKRFALGAGIERITMAGTRAYITRPAAGAVIVLDLTTDTVVTTIALGGSPRHVAINAAQTVAYVTDGAATSIARVTLNSLVVTRIDVGARTGGVAITPDDAFVYAVSLEKPEILVVATATDAQVNVNAADPTATDKGIKFYSSVLGTYATPFSIAMRALSTPDTNSGSSVLAYVATLDGFVYVVAPGGTAPHAVVDADTASGPSVTAIAYSVSGITYAAGADAPRPAGYDAGSTGILLTATPRILKPETFFLTFEGALVSSTVSRNSPQATMLDGGVLLDVGQHFTKAGVVAGDHVTFTGAVSPSSGTDCTGVDVDGNGNRIEWPIASVAADRVTLQPAPPAACYIQATAYEIRATGTWNVVGSLTTPLARLTENVPYDNGLFSLAMASGTSPSQRDARWVFSVSTGVVPTAYKLGTLLRGVFYAPTLARLYVVDEASRSIVELDAATGLALRVFR